MRDFPQEVEDQQVGTNLNLLCKSVLTSEAIMERYATVRSCFEVGEDRVRGK